MPLTVTERGGALYITGTVRPAGAAIGRRIRQRAGSNDPKLAREEAAAIEARILRDAHHGERPTTHTFLEAVESYLRHTPRSDGTKAYCRRLALYFRAAPLGGINQEAWDKARVAILGPDAGAGTVRRTLAVLIAILNHAERRAWLPRVPRFDKPPEPRGRTRFFLPDQADAMVRAGGHISPLIHFLFCTGCRLGEALALDWDELDLIGRRALLWEGETKGGARRVVELPPAAIAVLATLPHREGRVFLNRLGQPYRTGGGYGGQIVKAWAAALRRAGLEGFTPHETRHTWATWHYAVHRDLLLLQRDGGWSDVSMVARYAHLMPAGHEDAIRRMWGIGTALMEKRA